MVELEKVIEIWLGFLFAAVLTVLGFAVIAIVSVGTLKMLGVL